VSVKTPHRLGMPDCRQLSLSRCRSCRHAHDFRPHSSPERLESHPSRFPSDRQFTGIWVTLLPSKFATQMLAPSKAIPMGPLPTAKVPRVVPSLARSLVTFPLKEAFATQMLVPSNVGSIKGHGDRVPNGVCAYHRAGTG
jgi:hypothetical protein